MSLGPKYVKMVHIPHGDSFIVMLNIVVYIIKYIQIDTTDDVSFLYIKTY